MSYECLTINDVHVEYCKYRILYISLVLGARDGEHNNKVHSISSDSAVQHYVSHSCLSLFVINYFKYILIAITSCCITYFNYLLLYNYRLKRIFAFCCLFLIRLLKKKQRWKGKFSRVGNSELKISNLFFVALSN